MTPEDAREFVGRLTAARVAYGLPMDAAIGEVYFDALSSCSLAEARGALNGAIQTCERFPSPAELRQNIAGDRRRRALVESTQRALSESPTVIRFPAP